MRNWRQILSWKPRDGYGWLYEYNYNSGPDVTRYYKVCVYLVDGTIKGPTSDPSKEQAIKDYYGLKANSISYSLTEATARPDATRPIEYIGPLPFELPQSR